MESPDSAFVDLLDGLSPGELALLSNELESEATNDALWERCRDDIWYWLTEFVTTENHHREEVVLGGQPRVTLDPFPRMPHHELVVEAYWKPANVVVEKSRDMMLTWTVCAIFLWDLLFTENVQMFITTYQDYLVDDGGENATSSTLMGRILGMYKRLPPWMHERAPLRVKKGLIKNTKTGTYVSGKKASEHSSRSGKYYRAFADEFAHFERSEANLAALVPACPTGLMLGSTPGRTGRYNAFGRIVTTDPDKFGLHAGFKKVTLHWSMHPDRTHEWYQLETAKLSQEDKAREYDISYEGAVEARVWPFERDVHVADIEYRPELPLYLSFDHGLNEETVIFWQTEEKAGKLHRYAIDEYQGGVPVFGVKMTPWENAAELVKKLTAEPYNLEVDDEGKLVGLAGAYGDPRGSDEAIPVQSRKTDDTRLTSWHTVYAQNGIYIQHQFSKIKDGIILIADWLHNDPKQNVEPCMTVSTRCRMLIEAMINHRHATDKSTGKVLDRVVEDWTKHWCDSARYFAINTSSVRSAHAPKEPEYREVWVQTAGGPRLRYIPIER